MAAAAMLNFENISWTDYEQGNNCKMAFSLHVVKSVSDDYNF